MTAETLINKRGEQALHVLFGGGLLIVLIGLLLGSVLVSFAAAALVVGAVGVIWVMKRDHRALIILLIGFVSVARYEEGFQIEEILYALAFFGFLGYWFLRKFASNVGSLFRSKIDYLLVLYLLYAAVTLPWGLLNGAEIREMLGEFYTLCMLLLYFPLRQVFAESPDRWRAVLYALIGLAFLLALRNFWWYFIRMQSADQLWQLATGRIVMNEHVLMPSAVVCVTLYLYHSSRVAKTILFTVLAVLVAGIIIGQSRALWLSFGLALTVIFFASEPGHKPTIIRAALFGLALLGASAFALLGPDMFTLVFAGLLDRFFSLETAATQDISLVNRFNEMGAVFKLAIRNPIVGHGLGVPYGYFSMVYESTHVTSFVHNGYLHLFYRHGLVGLVLFGGFYVGVLWKSFAAIRFERVTGLRRAACMIALAVFIAIALSANSETPFGTSDKTLMLAICGALGVGASLPGMDDKRKVDE